MENNQIIYLESVSKPSISTKMRNTCSSLKVSDYMEGQKMANVQINMIGVVYTGQRRVKIL